MEELDAIDKTLKALGPKGQLIVTLAFAWVPFITRAYHSLRNGGGLKGIWNGILYGTNTPKKD